MRLAEVDGDVERRRAGQFVGGKPRDAIDHPRINVPRHRSDDIESALASQSQQRLPHSAVGTMDEQVQAIN